MQMSKTSANGLVKWIGVISVLVAMLISCTIYISSVSAQTATNARDVKQLNSRMDKFEGKLDAILERVEVTDRRLVVIEERQTVIMRKLGVLPPAP